MRGRKHLRQVHASHAKKMWLYFKITSSAIGPAIDLSTIQHLFKPSTSCSRAIQHAASMLEPKKTNYQ